MGAHTGLTCQQESTEGNEMDLFQASILAVAKPGTTVYQLGDPGWAPGLSARPFL